MSDSPSRLPVRPSLEQLRKQAKELLSAYRAGDAAAADRLHAVLPRLAEPGRSADVRLADTQFFLARDYGFESWPKLVHYVAALSPQGLEHFESITRDFVAANNGDADALARLGERFGGLEQLRKTVQQQRRSPDETSEARQLTLPDARLCVANALGLESWDALAASLKQPRADPRSAPHGLSTSPPFYRIDWKKNTLEPRQPLTDHDWETIIDVIREHGVTGVNANGQMTDESLERMSHLEHVTRLDLGGSKRLTDQGMLHLARMPQLQELVAGYPRRLEKLTCMYCRDTGDQATEHIAGLSRLRHYYAGQTQITDRSLEVLGAMTSLEEVELSACARISDAGLVHLATLPKLEKVSVDASASVTRGGINVFPPHVHVNFWT